MAIRQLSTKQVVNLASDPASGTPGEIYYNTVSNSFKYYNGSAWVEFSSGGAANSFEAIDVPNGTDPVADSATDTLTLTESNGIVITGNSSEDSIQFSTNATASNTASTIVARDADQAFDITAVDFDTTDTIASAAGRLKWDDGEGTLSLGLKGGSLDLQIGQENIALCYNGTGSEITKGSVVYISGAQGQRPSISLADADTEATSSKTFGVVAENILNGAEGFVATFGVVPGLNTSGFTAGQALWLSSTAGQLTNVKPTQPAHSVFIGYCLHVNESSGRIFVNPQNGYEIEELHNVLISTPADNHILSYDNATSLWKNQGLADAIQEVDGASSGIDADLLDGQHGSHYLDWTNTTNKPDPTITLGGDLSGSITLTDLAGGTLTATVADDSHNHIVGNIDGLQTALDAKAPLASPALSGTPTAPTAAVDTNTTQIATTAYVVGQGYLKSSSYTASDVLTKIKTVDGAASGLDSDLLDGQHGSYYLDWTNTTNKPDPTITLGGDASGSLTLTDLAGGTLTVTVADDSHNHIISNVDGLQTALNDKAPLASPALSGTPTAPTAASGTNTTQIATTAFVQSATAALVDSAPTTLDTLNELAAALGDDPNFATTVSTALGNKQPLDADLTAIAALTGTSGLLKKTAADTWTLDTTAYTTNTGTVTSVGISVPTGLSVSGTPVTTSGTIAISLASGYLIPTTTAFNAKAPLASPTFTGTVTADTLDLTTAATATTATSYWVETGSDGIVRPKTLANVRTEVVTTAAVNSAAATTVGTITSGTWQGSEISTTYTAAKVTSVNGSTGAVTGLATTAGKLSQFAATSSAELAGVISDETGSGALVFATSPSLTTPNIGAASGTSLSLTGSLTATSKSFDIEHPTKENMRLRYGSLEGPENGVYIRGKSDSSTIPLPNYWTGLVDEDSVTVQLTPIGKHRNLYVKDISNNTVTIGGARGEFEFFYFIQAERKDIDKLVVEYGS